VAQKVPGFMLIFIKIILTCNVAAALAVAEQKVKEIAADREREREGDGDTHTHTSVARRLIFSVLASLSRAGGRKSGGTKKASSSPAGHLKYLNAQNNKLENFCGPDNLYAPKELSERDTMRLYYHPLFRGYWGLQKAAWATGLLRDLAQDLVRVRVQGLTLNMTAQGEVGEGSQGSTGSLGCGAEKKKLG